MKILLSVVGTRGDVQPVIALALELRHQGYDTHLAIPPNFIDWVEKLGFTATSVGIEMRAPRKREMNRSVAISPGDLIADQFESVGAAAEGCDLILGANAHQYAARSIAEATGIPYINALYAPTALPVAENIKVWNERSLERVNASRAKLRLNPIDDVLTHIVTQQPLIAVDSTLSPLPVKPGYAIKQTGAWYLEDDTPLPSEVEDFLNEGTPPIYLGFGSMPMASDLGHVGIKAVLASGYRIIVSRGWADYGDMEYGPDCIAIDEVNHQILFQRVAAIVHHGGAGTTHNAARSGVPQIIVPMFSDQPYWASRIQDLGVGRYIPVTELSENKMKLTINEIANEEIVNKAKSLAQKIMVNGTSQAIEHIIRKVI